MTGRIRARFDRLIWSNMLYDYGMPGRILAYVLRYIVALVRDMFAGGLMMRSMSLVYTTLLSVVPLLAFSFSVLKGFGVHKQLEPLLFTMLEPLGEQGAAITQQIINLVDNVKGSVLGSISLAFFIYTAVSMVQKVEESFNYVWHVAKRQNFARRLIEYLVVLLIGPVVIVIALGMIASLKSNAVVQWLLEFQLLGPVIVATSKLTPYLLITGVFTFLYICMPNTPVRFRSALVGGVAAGFAWASVGVIFATFIVFSTRTQLIYSGFAVAITTLIWLYVNWLILLLGAQLAFYHQNPAYLRIGRREPRLSNSMRERLALNVMYLIGLAFRDGKSSETVRSLAQRMKMPSVTLTPIIEGLEAEHLLMTTESENLIPGRELSRIRLRDILAVVREHGETGSYRDPEWEPTVLGLCTRLDESIGKSIDDQTLADLLDEAESRAE
ncbi:MAG: YihY/virulence factor BrkB family protein [Proteobacteria bacterium]|nr:YihY/virulence factor BrkB family protein [Pseudomonadota bacterium]MDA1063399.1 YihY/virulence factor BrkB family protein [Pseudomonadota bacterium]